MCQREVREHAEGYKRNVTHPALSVSESLNKASVFVNKDSSVTANGVFLFYRPCYRMIRLHVDSVAPDVVYCRLWRPPYIICYGNIISAGISPENLGLSPVQI